MLPIMQYTTRRQFRVHGHFKSVRNNRRRLYKTATPTRWRPQKHFSELATYLAFFSVTYLATSLKLARFSVTERTAGRMCLRAARRVQLSVNADSVL